MSEKRLYLIDATAFCYRAFYALQGLSASSGQPTNAIYGFVNMLNKILKERKPEYLAVCFDVSRDTFRTKKFAEYKIQRPPMPEGLSSQIPIIKQLVKAFGLALFEKEGFEADDIIATLAKKAKAVGSSVTIVSSDKDILQLVDKDTVVFSPYKDKGVTYDIKKVIERFGVRPDRIPDIIALMGDDTDNIPGVSGIGEKTAGRLIADAASLDKLLSSLDKIKQDKLRDSILQNSEKIKLNKELAVLEDNVDVDFSFEKVKVSSPDTKELFKIFRRLEFNKLLKELSRPEDIPTDIALETVDDNRLGDFLKDSDEMCIYADSPSGVAFYTHGRCLFANSVGENLKKALEDEKIKKIGHDLKKIIVMAARQGVKVRGAYFDTMIASYLANPGKSTYTLGDLALDYLDQPFSNDIGHAKAVGVILKLRPRLEKELREKSLFKLFSELEMPLLTVLAEVELNGIKIDVALLRKLSAEIEQRLIKLIDDIYDSSGTQFNINSPKQLASVLFEKLKLPVVKRTKTGLSTDEEVLKKLAGRHELPGFLLTYRQLMKLKNTYIDTLPGLIDKKTGLIHTSFNQTGTETGRLSSSNPNLQNIPIKTDIGRNIRKAIISSQDKNYLVACDYSQVELRILAHLSKDKNLVSAFKHDKDIHCATAALIYGLEEREITDSMREMAKRVNFGIIYGQTSFGLSKDLGIGLDEAQKFIDAYFIKYPQVKAYIEGQIKEARNSGYVTTILGRRRYLPEINNKSVGMRQFAERQAVNTPIQGSAADLIKLAMIKIHEDLHRKRLNAKMILQIHDELVFDVPQEEVGELAGLVGDRMENVLKLDVPIKVDIKKGKNWLELEPV